MSRGLQSQSPSDNFALLTKSDSATLDPAPRALWVGTAGTANLTTANGTAVTSFPLLQGLNPIGISQLKTGGTATDIWALY